MRDAAKKLVFTAGLPGAGKSTILKSTEYAGLPVVDPDNFKESHEDYDPKNPCVLHDWSQQQARRLHYKYLADDISFVVDGTGTNIEKYLGWFAQARDLGYQIVVVYVKVKVATSIRRNANRERVVPVELIMKKAGLIDEAMDLLGSVADEYIVIENDED